MAPRIKSTAAKSWKNVSHAGIFDWERKGLPYLMVACLALYLETAFKARHYYFHQSFPMLFAA